MSTDSIIELENVGVTYRRRYSFFRHSGYTALRDINFEIRKGETLGIIGNNGSGKSTLLKVIAGVFRPDEGRVIRCCQSVSLLSLALGFDPELSGRSNAIICGMFLGSTRGEIQDKLEEIIEFSELGKFIDEPIKTYSTGMRARLGFSVALKMNADLLLIDEVLSVGDAQFRQKSEAAMVNKINSDQTVVFVAHSLSQMERICDRVLWLDDGKVRELDKVPMVIDQYKKFINSKA